MHRCWWCNEWTASMFWACERCAPLKEEGYRRAAILGCTSIADIYQHVYAVLKENKVVLADEDKL